MRKHIAFSRHHIQSPFVSSGLDGLRIAHLSDLHFRASSEKELAPVIRELADFNPHLLVFTGDAVVHDSHWPQASIWLKNLCPNASKLCVPGNWDYKYGWGGRFEKAMEAAGFEVLTNRGRRVSFGRADLQVAGLDDVRMGHPDPEAAWSGLDLSDFILAITHSPDAMLLLDSYPADLLLCGHTHGGQICLPKYGALVTSTWLGRPYAEGRHSMPGRGIISVSRGLGEGRIQVRLFCPRQVSLFTLTATASEACP